MTFLEFCHVHAHGLAALLVIALAITTATAYGMLRLLLKKD